MNEQLLTEAKRFAASTGRSLTALIEDALRQALRRPTAAPNRKPFKVETFSSDLMPGVNLDDSVDLYDAMDLDDLREQFGSS